MWAAVIPANNEESSINKVLDTVFDAGIDTAVVVANGCLDYTCERISQAAAGHNIHQLVFPEKLGIDVPRAVGAAYLAQYHPRGVVFLDGDMSGSLTNTLADILLSLDQDCDVALTNCYPQMVYLSPLAEEVLQERELLNRKLGLFNKIGLSTPSHGPHGLSKRFLALADPRLLAIPPLILAFAVQKGLNVRVAAAIPHHKLGSGNRNDLHAALIAQTIIGDCRLAFAYHAGIPLGKLLSCGDKLQGYQPDRRFDLLDKYLSSIN